MQEELISVIIPVYHVADYLERCIQSVTRQTYQNLQIILVDDGSKDICSDICDAWAGRDVRVEVIHKENAGLSAARNTGIEASNGQYLYFLDADDYIEPDMLELMYAELKKEDCEMAICNFVYEDEQGNALYTEREYHLTEYHVLSGRECLQRAVKYMYAVYEVAWNKLYKKELFQTLRYPAGKIHEDEYLFYPLFYPCRRVVCIPQVKYHYVQRSGSIMTQKNERKQRDYCEAYLLRCEYMLEQLDGELFDWNERKLVGIIREMKKAGHPCCGMIKKHARRIMIRALHRKMIPFHRWMKRMCTYL